MRKLLPPLAPAPHSPACSTSTVTSPLLPKSVKQESSGAGQHKTVSSFTWACFTAAEGARAPQQQGTPSAFRGAAGAGAGLSWGCSQGAEWLGLATSPAHCSWFSCKPEEKRKDQAETRTVLLALLRSFELQVCRSPTSTSSSSASTLWSPVHVFMVLQAVEAPPHPWVSCLCPTQLPCPFLLSPQTQPDLPEQPHT